MARTLTIDALAEELDIKVPTIRGYLKRGLPRSGKGTKASPFRFDAFEVAKWMTDHNFTGEPGRPQGPLSEEILKANLRKITAMAELKELELAQARDRLIDREKAERDILNDLTIVRNGMLSIPGPIAMKLVGKDAAEIEAALDERIREVLTVLATGTDNDINALFGKRITV